LSNLNSSLNDNGSPSSSLGRSRGASAAIKRGGVDDDSDDNDAGSHQRMQEISMSQSPSSSREVSMGASSRGDNDSNRGDSVSNWPRFKWS
jgi:hypothetical protein